MQSVVFPHGRHSAGRVDLELNAAPQIVIVFDNILFPLLTTPYH